MVTSRAFAIAFVSLAACGRFGFNNLPGDGINADGVAHDANALCTTLAPTTNNFKAIGNGTVASPWILCTPQQLVAMAYSSSVWTASYAVGADLDLAPYAPATSMPFPGIGNAVTPFTGTFDGQHFTISNVQINAPTQDDTGFFGVIASSTSLIQNVNLANITIAGRDNTGGLVGLDDRANLIDCTAAGTVTGRGYVGGLAGFLDQGALVSSSATNVTVNGTDSYMGGLVGYLGGGGEIFTSYALGPVNGHAYVGGLAGNTGFFAEIWESYATGDVTSVNGAAGGLVGYGQALLIESSFSTGNVTSMTATAGNSSWLLSGEISPGTAVNSFYLGTATCKIGGATCPARQNGETAKTPLAYFQVATNQPMTSWDFANVWVAPSGAPPTLAPKLFDYTAWGVCTTHMTDSPFAGGLGSPEQPFLICTKTQLTGMQVPALWQGKSFRLMNDISLPVASWTPIGNATSSATMIFDGNGKTISGFAPIDMNSLMYFGLFGNLVGGVKRLAMTGASVQANATNVGIIAGQVAGSTTDCYVTGTVQGTMLVGALSATQGGNVVNSYSTADVTSTGGPAGGVAYAPDGMYGSFGTGKVVGVSNSGQIAGYDTYIGTPCAQDTGAMLPGNYYTSGSVCTGCCTPAYGTPEVPTWFDDATNPPMNTWDLVNTWQPNAGALPTLR